MKVKKATFERRQFLLTIGAGAAATAAAIAVKSPLPERAIEVSNEKRRGKGYQESAHVRNYYRTTQI